MSFADFMSIFVWILLLIFNVQLIGFKRTLSRIEEKLDKYY